MILAILNYDCKVLGFHPAPNVEALYLKKKNKANFDGKATNYIGGNLWRIR